MHQSETYARRPDVERNTGEDAKEGIPQVQSADADHAVPGAEPRSRACARGRAYAARRTPRRLARLPATEHDSSTLANSIRQLDDFFLLVVVGEFNAGKSALINALLGERVVEEGVTPTTATSSWSVTATYSRARSMPRACRS